MNKPLRLLQVEDSESDAALIDRLLSKAGYDVVCERVETPGEMRAALGKQQWDIVIADYQLPMFNAPAALEILIQAELDTPFIIVSGMIGEDIAVAMMKAGAADYLTKSNLARLAPAVERELREAETRRERKNVVVALAEEKERLLVTLRSIGDGVITTDVRGAVTLMNKVSEELTGWSLAEAVNRPLIEIFKIINEYTLEACENPVEKVLKTGRICGLANHTALINRNGGRRLIADSGAPICDAKGSIIGVVLVFRDVTNEKRAEEALQNADKLRSLGVLAGGIAHDFNNLLNGVFGNIEMAKIFCESQNFEKVSSHLSAALSVFSRAKDLTEQLLTFAKGGKPVRKTMALADVIRKSSQFVLSGSNIAVDFRLADDLWLCEIDENQIGQVIDNVVINAWQAMPTGGTVTISAENIPAGSPVPPLLAPGDYVRIAIHDTGSGIAKEHLSRIFDPFFSTKRLGSGLGLATAYSIVKRHDGFIGAESDAKTGTTFFIFLPRSNKAATMSEKTVGCPDLKGGGRILVMDDEPSIRVYIKLALEGYGYSVECVSNGDEAIEKFRAACHSAHPFNLLILDLTIPGGKGGGEIISELKSIDPFVTAIVSSGYSDDPIMANPSEYGFSRGLIKPYPMTELINAVKSLEKN
ncbi:MAG: response regulator [Candidatus Ozemobacteraceae bacterium]